MRRLGEHGVVLGASMAGLLAARVLSEAYQRVTVIDRDVLPEVSEDRRGVPQGRHAHALLARGAQIIEELFPGFLSELVASGVPVSRDLAESHFDVAGHQLCPQDHRVALLSASYLPSRAHLENLVRTRLRDVPNVEIMPSCEAVGLATRNGQGQVTGVRIRHHGDRGPELTLEASLVVDATGRSGRAAAAWLPGMGYQPPPEERVPVQVKYVTQRLRIAPGAMGRILLVIIGARPDRPTTLFLVAQENDRWTLTLGGYDGHHPPTDPEQFLEFIQPFAPPHILAAIRSAELLTEPATHRFPANLRRRYERMTRFPTGLLVFGDALCSFNPVYGQGMTVAAMQANTLRDCLGHGDTDLARRFFRAAAKPIGAAWQLAVGADLALPEVPGQLPRATRVVNAYMDRLLTAAERDPALAESFFRVTTFLDPPTRLFSPRIIRRVLAGNWRLQATRATQARPCGVGANPERTAEDRPTQDDRK